MCILARDIIILTDLIEPIFPSPLISQSCLSLPTDLMELILPSQLISCTTLVPGKGQRVMVNQSDIYIDNLIADMDTTQLSNPQDTQNRATD